MSCPQCGGPLATYALSDREASVCEDCGYVGIAAEHRGDPRTVESWDDALRRFYRAHGSDGAPSVDLQPPLSRPAAGSAGDGESWDDALRRFHARRASGATAGDDSDAESNEPEADTTGDGEDVDDIEDANDDDASPTETATAEGDEDGVEADAGSR
jgi:hypothetical protein